MARKTQHRAQRDTSNAENATLKRDNQRLQRQIARLRKQIDQASQIEEIAKDDQAEIVEDFALKCPDCKSRDLHKLELPSGKTVVSCKECKKKVTVLALE